VMTVVIWGGLLNTVSNWPVASLSGRLVTEVLSNLILVVALRPVVRWLLPESVAVVAIG